MTFRSMPLRSLTIGAVLAVSGLAGNLAHAAPAGVAVSVVQVHTAPLAEQVQYRRGYGGFYGGYRGGNVWRRPGPYIGLGIGAGILAGSIIYSQSYLPRRGAYYDTYAYSGPYYYPEDFRGDPREMCARYFKSFEWRTGMYTTYGGERRPCPYLQRD